MKRIVKSHISKQLKATREENNLNKWSCPVKKKGQCTLKGSCLEKCIVKVYEATVTKNLINVTYE